MGSSEVLDALPDRKAGRVTIITNGNYFSNLGLEPLLCRLAASGDVQVVITSGLRKQTGNRLTETWGLLRRWGWRYFTYKVTTLALPVIGALMMGRDLNVEKTAKRLGVLIVKTRNANNARTREKMNEFGPSLLLSFSCPHRIKPKTLAIPSIGCLNVHSSLLPAYAGVCTYIHVLAHGEPFTGITIHEMTEEFDAGAILAQSKLDIPEGISVFHLFSLQCLAASRLLVEVVEKCLRSGSIEGIPQHPEGRSYFGEPTKEDIAQLRLRGFRLVRLRELLDAVFCREKLHP